MIDSIRKLCRQLASMAVLTTALCPAAPVWGDEDAPPEPPPAPVPQAVVPDSTVPDVPGRAEYDHPARELPSYVMDIDFDPDRRVVRVTQQVHWKNQGTQPAGELVFQVIPNNRPSKETIALAGRTLESLRIDPRTALDERGGRFCLHQARRGDVALKAWFSRRDDTHLHLTLDEPVAPGESVSVELVFTVSIPPVMGRMGQYRCVTNLLNWYPVLAVHRCDRWQPVPYVPWHQPFYNEAGNYSVLLRLPQREKVVTGGHVVETRLLEDGRQELVIEGSGLRDFTIISSRRFQEWRSEINGIPLRVVAFAEHAQHAQLAMRTAAESIATYESWFGPYPYEEFELAESYFGWNGNESSGVVMIDERIFDAPQYAGRYLEHLISHEICHQWWYSAVGTNGYAEPWMDEGLVQWFTRVRIEDKYGPDPLLLELPATEHCSLPNIRYRSLVHNGYNLFRQRGGKGVTGGTLDDMGHIHNLFFLVYDRGARITGMIQNRMGRQNFFAFMSYLYHKYRYDILSVAQFQCELEQWTGCSWDHFFTTWLRRDGTTDWKVEDVEVTETEHGYRTEAHISQQGDIAEPVRIGLSATRVGAPFRYLTLNEAMAAREGVSVRRESPTDWLVTVVTQQEPKQLIVDPDMWGLEANRRDNTWKKAHAKRLSPIYSPADEASMVQPWQQDSMVAGFGVDSDARLGFRAALVSANSFRISPFVAYTAATARNNDDHISAGIDAVLYNFPATNWQLLGRYEHALLSTLANDPGHQARVSLRHILQYTTSLIYPNLSYLDIYARAGDNFFPDRDTTVSPNPAVTSYNDVRAFGVEFHLDTQMPYWDPDRGMRFDAGYEHGFAAFSRGSTYDRLTGQLSVVQRVKHGPCWLQQTKVAGRVAGGYGWDNSGEHFRFGGPGRFRGVQAADVEGNAFWLASAEWRFPLTGEIDHEVADNTASLHSVDGSLFYDVGRSYLFDRPQGSVDHAVGAGLYFEIPILSFVEKLTIRTEYGYSLVNETSAFWFGLYRAF